MFILTEKLFLVFFTKKSSMTNKQKEDFEEKLTKSKTYLKKYNFTKL